jgi:hypothetical protein
MMMRNEFPHNSLFLEEMVIPAKDTRIDLAVVNGSLHGFEIKSDVDTLRRLPVQRDSYNDVFDQMSLVVAARHFKAAAAIVPEWWGLAVACRTNRGVNIEWPRVPSENPNLNPAAVVKLLWRKEVERALAEIGLCSATSKYYIYELNKMLIANVTTDVLREVVRGALKERHGVD